LPTLWRLEGVLADVECFVVENGDRFAICVERRGELFVAEMYEALDAALRRAEELRVTSERRGLVEVQGDR